MWQNHFQETFYDPKHHTGYLCWRIRNVKRKKEFFAGSPAPKAEAKKLAFDGGPCSKKKCREPIATSSTSADISPETVESHCKWLQAACAKSQTKEIIVKMRETFSDRSQMLLQGQEKEILIKYPRFLDVPDLVSLFLSLLGGNILHMFSTYRYLISACIQYFTRYFLFNYRSSKTSNQCLEAAQAICCQHSFQSSLIELTP